MECPHCHNELTPPPCPRCGMTEVLSAAEAAKVLQISKPGVINMVKRGEFPDALTEAYAGQHGMRYLIPKVSVEAKARERALAANGKG